MRQVAFSGIEVWRAEFPLRISFSHNLATRDRVETLLVAVRCGGSVGFGQALPRSYLTGESLESVSADIKHRWWPLLAGLRVPAAGPEAIGEALHPVFMGADALRRNASFAAVDIAARDAYARESGTMFGATGDAPRLPLVGVISAGGRRKAAWTARALKWLGYRHFKVKVGRDTARDERLLATVRRVIGKNAWLAVDANAAWELEEAVERMRDLGKFGVVLAEEPLTAAAAATADFARLEEEAGMAVMADESLCTLSDAEALLARGSPSWWNLRLAKNGGATGMTEIAARAADRGVAVYGGILVGETSLLAAASAAIMPGIGARCAEYGFPRVFLRRDPFRGGPGGFAGTLASPRHGTRGLGVCLNSASFSAVAYRLWRQGEPAIGDY